MNFIDLSYHSSSATDPQALLEEQQASLGYLEYLQYLCNLSVVKCLNYSGELRKNRVNYYFFRGKSSKFWWPYTIHRFNRRLNPSVVLVHGFIYPLQVYLLRKQLGREVKILLQHHADKPVPSWRLLMQKQVDKYIDGYLFSSAELAESWISQGIIKDRNRVFELPAGSTSFRRQDRESARKITGVTGDPVFLWVGRLDENKDPITVISAFHYYLKVQPKARLYMIFHGADLLYDVKHFITEKNIEEQVFLKGRVSHDLLQAWYNSADYILSGSHAESYGFSLVEAMACGCIPVVTDIPSFRKITADGTLGFLYPHAQIETLVHILLDLHRINISSLSEKVTQHFRQALSYQAIAERMYTICRELTAI
jgi:glycosyltransferase involved in cell wall biosynthesis